MSTPTQKTMTLKVSATSAPKRVHQYGNEYIVIPVVAAKEGVMNGVYYSEDLFKRTLNAWEHTPVVLYHPKNEIGEDVTARTLDVIHKRGLGTFQNVSVSEKKLLGEFWLEVWKTSRIVGEIILAEIEAGTPMDVSIGVFASTNEEKGKHGEDEYTEVMTELFPDHVALLYKQEGACSLEKGCGTMKTNCECQEPKASETEKPKAFDAFKKFLSAMAGEDEAAKKGDEPVEDEKKEVVAPKEEAAETEQKEEKAEEIISSEAKEALAYCAKQKDEKIASIVANSKMTKEELKVLSLEALGKLEAGLTPANYSGRALNTNSTEQDAYTPPTIFDIVKTKGAN